MECSKLLKKLRVQKQKKTKNNLSSNLYRMDYLLKSKLLINMILHQLVEELYHNTVCLIKQMVLVMLNPF